MHTDDLYIDAVEIYKNDVVIVRSPMYPPKTATAKGKKTDIVEFSYASRKKLAFVAANTHVSFQTMITLTYPAVWESDGKEVKRHLRAFLQYLRRVDPGVEYLWFCEFQRRGAPHFHVLTDTAVSSYCFRDVSKRWNVISGKCDSDHLKAGTRVERLRSSVGGAHYAVKYAMKARQKKVPVGYRNVGRFWGHSAGVKPKMLARHPVRNERELELYLLAWLRDNPRGSIDYRVLFGATKYLERARGLTY